MLYCVCFKEFTGRLVEENPSIVFQSGFLHTWGTFCTLFQCSTPWTCSWSPATSPRRSWTRLSPGSTQSFPRPASPPRGRRPVRTPRLVQSFTFPSQTSSLRRIYPSGKEIFENLCTFLILLCYFLSILWLQSTFFSKLSYLNN